MHFEEGLSGRQIARDFGISRDSVSKMLSYSEPSGYRRTAPIKRPKLDPYLAQIDSWLAEDKTRPRKQRHTAKKIFERLRDECGFDGGYTIVKDYVRAQKRSSREMFVPLSHPPGHGQADFGEALVVIGGVEQKAYFFAFDLPHSDACYIRAYPAANTEAWLDGHVHAFAFFGAVPRSVLYDNDRCLVAKIMPDGTRNRTQRFSAMLSHYVIGDRYGRPGKGNEQGIVRHWLENNGRAARLKALSGTDGATSWCRSHALLTGMHSTTILKSNAANGRPTFCVAIRSASVNDCALISRRCVHCLPRPLKLVICKAARSHQHPKYATVATITQCRLPMATHCPAGACRACCREGRGLDQGLR